MRTFYLLACFLSLSLGGGCSTARVIENTRVPEVAVDAAGLITFNNKTLQPHQLVSEIRSAGIARTQEINVLIPENPDRKLMQTITAELVRGGYTRTIFLKNRKATATLGKPK